MEEENPNEEIARLKAQMEAMQARMQSLFEHSTSTARTEFETNWWIPIKGTRPDFFLRDLMSNGENPELLDPESIWQTTFAATDKASLNKKLPEVVKTPELSPETWALVCKDKALKLKCQTIHRSMVNTKHHWNIWFACLRSIPEEVMINLPPEAVKNLNMMSASLSIEAATHFVDLRNIGRDSVNAPKIQLSNRQHADEDDGELYARERDSRSLTDAIVVGLKSSSSSNRRPPPAARKPAFEKRERQRVTFTPSPVPSETTPATTNSRRGGASGRGYSGRGRGRGGQG
jgi:hypothetical protein